LTILAWVLKDRLVFNWSRNLPGMLPGLRSGRLSMATADVQGKDETKLANGGGAFPFWVSVVIVAGFFAILFGIVYGIVSLFA